MTSKMQLNDRLVQELETRNEFGSCAGCTLDILEIVGGGILMGFTGGQYGSGLVSSGAHDGWNDGDGNCE